MGCGLSTPEPPHRPLRRDDRMIYWKTKKQLEEEAAEQQRRKELEQSRIANRRTYLTNRVLAAEQRQKRALNATSNGRVSADSLLFEDDVKLSPCLRSDVASPTGLQDKATQTPEKGNVTSKWSFSSFQ